MAREHDKYTAFKEAIWLNPKGYQCLKTSDFIAKLQKHNWHFTPDDANSWIFRNQPDFKDTTDQGDNRLWILRNMGRVR